jgi:hypothetical protein
LAALKVAAKHFSAVVICDVFFDFLNNGIPSLPHRIQFSRG